MSKRGSSDRIDTGGKKQRKTITLEEKFDAIRRYECNECMVDIVNAMGIPKSTLRTVRKQADKTKQSCKSAMRMTATKITQIRALIMEKLERMLARWIEHEHQCAIPLSTMIIQAKAKSLFDNLNAIEFDPKVPSFDGSAGWFERFKGCHGFHNLKLTGEAAAADLVAAEKFPALIKATGEEHGCLPQQVFSLDETRLFWKRMLSRMFVSVQEKVAPGFKASKDRCMLLLVGNASGDYKIKPLMVYQSENPRVLKGYSKESLPVVWRSNKKAWITTSLFEFYFTSELHHELQAYCAL
jgi:hypothetical protein